MPSKNFYYHKSCYDDWKAQRQRPDENWVDMIYDFIARDLKVSYNWHMIEAQRKKFINEHNLTNKGIYYTLYWYFYIKNNKWEEDYGIGLIPHIYEDSARYWSERERQVQGIMKQIEDFVEQRNKDSAPLKISKRQKKNIKAPE